MRIWIPIALALFLSSCASALDLREVVLEDVRQATIMAERTDDTLSLKCWTYLETVATAEGPRGKVVGVLSAYQKVRNVRRRIENSDQRNLACGPMLIDSAQAVKRGFLFF